MRLTPKDVRAFQTKILTWYSIHKRDLPWRQTRDPYRILVSEIMLQQTQVSRVIPKYEVWLTAFPNVQSLAKATVSDVLRLWSGLGYNRRALYLQKTAQEIVQKYNNAFPQEYKLLQTLPGIGDYTARAVACFAFDAQIAVVDTNVRKVILVEFNKLLSCHCEDPASRRQSPAKQDLASRDNLNHKKDCRATLAMTQKEIQHIADQLLPKKILRLGSGRLFTASAYEWNQALMDYGSAMLKKEKVLPRSGILLRKTKQSRFRGSNRYYRGMVIKTLLEMKQLEIEELGKLLKPEFSVDDKLWLTKLLLELERNGFIRINKQRITLTE